MSVIKMFFSCFVVCLLATNGYAKIFTYEQLTDNDLEDRLSRYHSNNYSWMGYDSKSQSLFMSVDDNVKEFTGKELGGFIGTPSVYKDTTVFRVWDRADTHSFYKYNPTEGLTTIATSPIGPFDPRFGYQPSYASIDPFIHEGGIVYPYWDGNDYEIMLSKNGVVTQITNNDTDDYEPQIHQGKIAWTGWGGNEETKEDVFMYDQGTIYNVSQMHAGKDEDANIWGDTVVWTGRAYEYNDSQFDILSNKDGVVGHVDYMTGNDFEPDVYDDQFVWHNRLPSGKYQVVFYDGYKRSLIAPGGQSAIGPDMHGDGIVFSAHDGNDYELFRATYTLGKYDGTTYDGIYRGVVSNDQYAFVAGGNHGVKIFDTSDASNPSLVSSYRGDGEVFDLALRNDLVFSASREGGIDVLDVSNSLKPTLKKHLNIDGVATKLELRGDYLYVGAKDGGMHVVSVAQPDSPKLVSTVELEGSTYGVDFSGDLGFIANYYKGMSVVDFSDPNNPQLINRIQGLGPVWDVAVQDGLAYLATPGVGVTILDVQDPMDIMKVATIDASTELNGWSSPLGIELYGDIALLSGGLDGMLVLDINDPLNGIVERYDTNGFVWSAILDGQIAFVADGDAGLKSFDMSDYVHPTPIPGSVYLLMTSMAALVGFRNRFKLSR